MASTRGRYRLAEEAVGWLQVEVEALNTARIAGWPDDQIRALVARLEAARPASFPTNNPNTNPRLKAGRDKFIADVRAGKRPAPRRKARDPSILEKGAHTMERANATPAAPGEERQEGADGGNPGWRPRLRRRGQSVGPNLDEREGAAPRRRK